MTSSHRFVLSVLSKAPRQGSALSRDAVRKALADLVLQREQAGHPTGGDLKEEMLQRETKLLQSALSQFLTTPLRSDAAEVQRTITDSLRHVATSHQEQPPRQFLYGYGGEFLREAGPTKTLTDPFTDGIQHLSPLMRLSDSRDPVFEELAVLEGTFTLALMLQAIQMLAQQGDPSNPPSAYWGEVVDLRGEVPQAEGWTGLREIIISSPIDRSGSASVVDVGKKIFESVANIDGVTHTGLFHFVRSSALEVQVRMLSREQYVVPVLDECKAAILALGQSVTHGVFFNVLIKRIHP